MINSHRAQAIIDLSPPKTLEQLYHLIGLFNFYCIFVYNFAEIMKPLTRLTTGVKMKKNDNSWKQLEISWGEDQDKSFSLMKHILSNPPVLSYPDWTKPFILYVDASKNAFAFALHQVFDKESHESGLSNAHLPIPDPTDDDNSRSKWKAALLEDSLYQGAFKQLLDGQKLDQYFISKSALIWKSPEGNKICVPKSMIRHVFNNFHDSVGHARFRRSWSLLSNEFTRPGVHTLLKNYIDACPTCQRTKSTRMLPEGNMPEQTSCRWLSIPSQWISL